MIPKNYVQGLCILVIILNMASGFTTGGFSGASSSLIGACFTVGIFYWIADGRLFAKTDKSLFD